VKEEFVNGRQRELSRPHWVGRGGRLLGGIRDLNLERSLVSIDKMILNGVDA
jgi:hypothetical protein